jgi:hypothetical protein
MAVSNDRIATIVKWGIGGLVVYNLLNPEAKKGIHDFVSRLGEELAAAERRKALADQLQKITDLKPKSSISTGYSDTGSANLITPAAKPKQFDFTDTGKTTNALVITKPTLPAKPALEPDAEWRNKLVHPSIVLILGKRGSGKSALGYRLLELFRYGPKPYVVGVPAAARSLLPEWIGIVPSLEDLPNKSIAIIDEAYLHYHARGSLAQESKQMSQVINLSRQKEQTIIFVTQEARQIDKNIASSANIIIFKDLGILQLKFDRPELNQLATKAKEAFNSLQGDKHRWSYVHAPDTDFQGLLENNLPSFWKPGLSRIFASGAGTPVTRSPRKLTVQDKVQKAREMRTQGASYSEIARELGVTKGSVVNYLKGYPYQS